MSYDYAVRGLHKVVDGDTLDLVIDVGFRALLTQRIRLEGINAPERGLPGSVEAWSFLFDWLVARTGKLRVITTKEDSFGRWIGKVYDRETGESVSEAMLAAGLATQWVRK